MCRQAASRMGEFSSSVTLPEQMFLPSCLSSILCTVACVLTAGSYNGSKTAVSGPANTQRTWEIEKAHPWLGSLYDPDETCLLLGPTWRHRGYLGTCASLSDTEAQGKSNCTSTGQASAYITSANTPFPRANSTAKPKVKEWGSDCACDGAGQGVNV